MNRIAQLFLALLILSGPLGAQGEDYPPGTFQLTPQLDLHLVPVPVAIPEKFRKQLPGDRTLKLPPGFSARVFATGPLGRGRFMAFSPEGVLHVADMRGDQTKESQATRIVAFPDRDNDGVADTSIIAADQLSYAHSLVFYQGDLYVAETHQITRLRDEDRDGIYEKREVFVADIPNASPGFHGTRTMVFDERRGKIYLSVGSPCDLCRPEDPVYGNSETPLPPDEEWGTILQFDMDGTGRRIFARGIRNVVGLALHPVTGELWGDHNGHDLEGPNLPPEWIDLIRDGDFMGFPFAYGYQVSVNFALSNEYQRVLPLTHQDSLKVQRMKRPVALVPAHLAPMGIYFYTGEQFPSRYRHVAFVALRGGQVPGNLAVVPGFKVVALFTEPDGSNARVADFLAGFYTTADLKAIWGKPVGIIADRQGNLYVSSDYPPYLVLRVEAGPLIGSWEHPPPDSAQSGVSLDLKATVRLDRFAKEGERPRLTADLSALGGPATLPLKAVDDSTYRLETALAMEVPNGMKRISVEIAQGAQRIALPGEILVLPAQDLLIFGDGLQPGWTGEYSDRIKKGSFAQDQVVYEGTLSSSFQVDAEGFGGWSVRFVPAAPVEPQGYRALRFAFRPGPGAMAEGNAFNVTIGNFAVRLLGGDAAGPHVEVERQEWQVVEVPLDAAALKDPIELIRFSGTVEGEFYLDDIRLVAAELPQVTAVLEETGAPPRFALAQNYPNPFNNSTIIRFSLAARQEVELAVYNLAGQKVATLAEGMREPGQHTVRWGGRELASGVYLCRLRAGAREERRKMVLLR